MSARIEVMSNRIIIPNEQVTTHVDYMRMRLISFSMLRMKSGWVQRMLSPFWRLYCNLDEGVEVLCEGRTFPLRARRVYLVPAWLLWSGRTKPGVRHIWTHFDLPGMTRSLSRTAFPLPIQIYPRAVPEKTRAPIDLAGQFAEMGAAVSATPSPDALLVCWAKSLTYWGMREAFAQLSPELRTRCLNTGTGHHPLMRVLNLIDMNLHQELSNAVLAEAVPCSRPHLPRLFRSLLGVSPARYVTERRVSRAAELLLYGDESLDQVAELCGFPNRHYFTRVFTRVLGTPPARYRNAMLRSNTTGL